jgi:hypothetical protein
MDFKSFEEIDSVYNCDKFVDFVNIFNNGDRFYIVVSGEDINKVEDIMTINGYEYKFRNIHELMNGVKKTSLIGVTIEKVKKRTLLWFRLVLSIDSDYNIHNYKKLKDDLNKVGLGNCVLVIDSCDMI